MIRLITLSVGTSVVLLLAPLAIAQTIMLDKITAGDGEAGDVFGTSVSLHGDSAIVAREGPPAGGMPTKPYRGVSPEPTGPAAASTRGLVIPCG